MSHPDPANTPEEAALPVPVNSYDQRTRRRETARKFQAAEMLWDDFKDAVSELLEHIRGMDANVVVGDVLSAERLWDFLVLHSSTL